MKNFINLFIIIPRRGDATVHNFLNFYQFLSLIGDPELRSGVRNVELISGQAGATVESVEKFG